MIRRLQAGHVILILVTLLVWVYQLVEMVK